MQSEYKSMAYTKMLFAVLLAAACLSAVFAAPTPIFGFLGLGGHHYHHHVYPVHFHKPYYPSYGYGYGHGHHGGFGHHGGGYGHHGLYHGKGYYGGFYG